MQVFGELSMKKRGHDKTFLQFAPLIFNVRAHIEAQVSICALIFTAAVERAWIQASGHFISEFHSKCGRPNEIFFFSE